MRVIDARTAGVTLKVVEPAREPRVAVTVAGPTAMPVAKPLAVRVEIAVFDEFQVTDGVRLFVLPSV